jgi:hypothetical protein
MVTFCSRDVGFAALITLNFSFGVLAGPDVARADGYMPPNGLVPNAAVAGKIAEDVLVPIYGEAIISKELPLKVELHGDIWFVRGTLPAGRLGGVAEIRIDKRDGRISYVMHGK